MFSDELFRVGLRVIIFSFLKCKLVEGLLLKEICRVRLQFIYYDLLSMVNTIQLRKMLHIRRKRKQYPQKNHKEP